MIFLPAPAPALFTIGYEGLDIAAFIKPKVVFKLGKGEAADSVFIQVMQFKVPEVAQQDVAGLFFGFQSRKIVFGLFEALTRFLPRLLCSMSNVPFRSKSM